MTEQFYINNANLLDSETYVCRGNKVSDCYGANVIGIQITNCNKLRAKDNSAVRMRSISGTAEGIKVDHINEALLIYNVASRADIAFDYNTINSLTVYNATTHDCGVDHSFTAVPIAEMYNLALSVYEDHKSYLSAVGFLIDGASSVEVDYVCHYGLATLSSGGTFSIGQNVFTDKPLYTDEPNDDLTPDNISILVNTGIDNPISGSQIDIGGIESEVTNEITADRTYHRQLLDNTFYDVDDDTTAEVTFIKAFQSRVLANTELAISTVKRNFYIKQMQSALGFSDLWPTQTYDQNSSKFQKRVMDLWFAAHNPGAVQSLQNGIGGYNSFPSFFKRREDDMDAWVLGVSTLAVDNTLLGYESAKYGVLIDFLGTSTLSQAASGDCYNNVMQGIASMAPHTWNPHEYPQPLQYLIFTDMWNNYEDCVLTNMIYNEDFSIQPTEPNIDCTCITPLIPTGTYPISGVVTIGPAPSGGGLTEISLLDRMYSEVLTRQLYYRQGNDLTEIEADAWAEILNVIGGYILLDKLYVQFKLGVQNVLRVTDYEFVGLALRPWTQRRTGWPNQPQPTPPPTPPIIISFTATPNAINLGDPTVLAWHVTGAISLNIDNGVGSVTPVTAGNIGATPTATTIYTLTATNSVGMFVTSTVSVAVTIPNYMYLTGFSAYRYLDGDLTQLFDSGLTNESHDIMPFSTTDIWLAGEISAGAEVELWHYNGIFWDQYLASTNGIFYCVNGIAPDDIWAGGCSGANPDAGPPILYHFDGISWTSFSLPSVHSGFGAIKDLLVFASDDIYAVGEVVDSGFYYLLVYHWDGDAWANIISPPFDAYPIAGYSIWGTDLNNIWIGGNIYGSGIILKYNGTDFSIVLAYWDYSWVKSINALYGFSVNDIWAVGGDTSGGSVIVHWDGATWSHITDPVASLNVNWAGVWGKTSDDVFITGFVTIAGPDLGKRIILHWDGATLTEVYRGTSSVLVPSFDKMKGILS